MRKDLKKINKIRTTFRGVFERYGEKPNWHGYPVRTVLLKDIATADGNIVTDHLWFNFTKAFDALGELNQGDIVEFQGRVSEYEKRYVNRREYIDERTTDYKISFPTRVRLCREEWSEI